MYCILIIFTIINFLSEKSLTVEVKRIGVHCLAGLGRAPFLVAIAMVNNGCTGINAINLIRKNRPGAINLTQTNYILEYKAGGGSSSNASCKCIIF